jgi:hypothetical protein
MFGDEPLDQNGWDGLTSHFAPRKSSLSQAGSSCFVDWESAPEGLQHLRSNNRRCHFNHFLL